jgi:hypothetical protein
VPHGKLGKDWLWTGIELWKAREAGDTEQVRRLLLELTAGYVGVADVPFYCFAIELADLYPNAKVVLVERDPTS